MLMKAAAVLEFGKKFYSVPPILQIYSHTSCIVLIHHLGMQASLWILSSYIMQSEAIEAQVVPCCNPTRQASLAPGLQLMGEVGAPSLFQGLSASWKGFLWAAPSAFSPDPGRAASTKDPRSRTVGGGRLTWPLLEAGRRALLAKAGSVLTLLVKQITGQIGSNGVGENAINISICFLQISAPDDPVVMGRRPETLFSQSWWTEGGRIPWTGTDGGQRLSSTRPTAG